MHSKSLFLILGLSLSAASFAEDKLNFDDLFPRRPFTGKAANGMEWSHDDHYMAYLWNPYKDKGMDIWLYDARDGSTKRLTSMDVMKPFDRDLPKAIERYKKDDEELDKADQMNDLDYREWSMKKKKENALQDGSSATRVSSALSSYQKM